MMIPDNHGQNPKIEVQQQNSSLIQTDLGGYKVPNYIDKQEVVRRANALLEIRDERIKNQKQSIDRLLIAWASLGDFVNGMADELKEHGDTDGFLIAVSVLAEMNRLTNLMTRVDSE